MIYGIVNLQPILLYLMLLALMKIILIQNQIIDHLIIIIRIVKNKYWN